MKKSFLLLSILLLSLTIGACGGPQSSLLAQSPTPAPVLSTLAAQWTFTTPDAPWQDGGSVPLLCGTDTGADIVIDTGSLLQEVTGFGGCFNEKGWEVLSILPLVQKEAVIRELFDPIEGAKFNLCRVPIGASDYAISRYTLNETAGDYGMNDFSIERDREYLIPYIKAAMAYKPDLKVWGSAWTPPTWMKTNGDFDGGGMLDDPDIYQAYALYLARFVEEYQAEGIDLFAVAVQNEPLVSRHYPTCVWRQDQYRTFIRDHLGPLFRDRPVNAAIMLGTFNEGNFYTYPNLLSDPEVSQYVSIAGFQWDGLYAVAQTRERFPDIQIYQTEADCGNWYWREGYEPDRAPNDWAYGSFTWDKIKAYFDEGVNAYLLWNMVLDEEGKSIDSESPWPQNAAVTVDKDTGKVTYTPMFYAFKHFTYYVEPGARYVDIGKSGDAVAFLNPDGTLIVELQNKDSGPRTVILHIDGDTLTLDLPGPSWNTLVVPAH